MWRVWTSSTPWSGAYPWCLLIAVVFTLLAAGKAVDPNETIQVFQRVLGLDTWSSTYATILLLVVEFGLAVWLAGGWRVERALTLVLAFLLMTTGLLGWLMWAHPEQPCGCGLPASLGLLAPRDAKVLALTRNVLLILVAVVALRSARRSMQT